MTNDKLIKLLPSDSYNLVTGPATVRGLCDVVFTLNTELEAVKQDLAAMKALANKDETAAFWENTMNFSKMKSARKAGEAAAQAVLNSKK